MDYIRLSDAEIEARVSGFQGIHSSFGIAPRYCSNPADAWPIIFNNSISMVWDCAEDGSADWWNAYDKFDECRSQYHSNPLRACMIVYLMMQEGK